MVRVFDQFGERNRRNKARMKFLIKEQGFETFEQRVFEVYKSITIKEIAIEYKPIVVKETDVYKANESLDED